MFYLFLAGFVFLCLVLNVNAQTKTINLKNKFPSLVNHTITSFSEPVILGQQIDSENDGGIYAIEPDFYTARMITPGDGIFNDGIIAYSFYDDETSSYINVRSPIQFDLSGIDLSKIVSATINLYPVTPGNASTTEVAAFYRGGQANPFTSSDYQNFDNSVQYTDDIDFTQIIPDQYNQYALNNDGINYLKSGGNTFMFVNKTYDLASTTPPSLLNNLSNTFVFFAGSTYNDGEIKPYLDLVLSSTSTPPVESTSSCAIIKNNDISIISGCTSVVDQNGTSTSYYSFYIPAILYFFVYSLMVIMLFIISIIYPIFRFNKNKK